MRITFLSCAILALTAASAAAQTTYVGPWLPRPSIGVGLGVFGAITNNGSGNRIQSGTLEIPLADNARIRIEAGRTTLPILPPGPRQMTVRVDNAHLERATVSVAGLLRPGAPVTPYVGAGVIFQRATFDHAPRSPITAGLHVHAGAEVMAVDTWTLDFEVGFQGFGRDPWYQRDLMTGEAMIRLKLGL
jgi:opacity protein-like surface antigen